jgi:Phosphotransferase enzyme family
VGRLASSGTSAVGRLAPGILRAAGLGSRCPVASVTRLAGGSKKGVYRLGCSGGFSAVLYVWSAAEDFWPADAGGDGGAGGADAGVFGHASGLGLFAAASQRLAQAGVRVPLVYLTDASRALYPADIALVEDVRGGTLEELLAADPSAAAPVMERLGEMLRSMWGQRAARVGRVADVPPSGDPAAGAPRTPGTVEVEVEVEVGGGASSERIVLERALRQLAGAADRVPGVAAARPRLDETLRALAASVRPRASYGLIHGELGPDHVSIDDRGQPVVVDIEGAMYFDVEWEHAFLRLRFGRDYEWLRVGGLDEHRMSLYALALDLSLIEGPLRLLDGDYPDREEMLAIAGWAVDRVLRTANADRPALSGPGHHW